MSGNGERGRFEIDATHRRTFAKGDPSEEHGLRGLSRQKTLVRPERQRTQRAPMLRKANAAPPTARVGATTARLGKQLPEPEALLAYSTPSPLTTEDPNWWTYFSRSMTCCVWPRCMEACGMTDKNIQQAWREKVTLCMIIGFLCFFVGFFSFGLKPVLCPNGSSSSDSDAYLNQTDHLSVPYRDGVIIFGSLYDFNATARMLAQRANIELTADWHGIDISRLFAGRPTADCMTLLGGVSVDCTVPNPFPLSPALQPPDGVGCPDPTWLSGIGNRRLFFPWSEVSHNVVPPHSLLVFNGAVLNLTSFLATADVVDIPGMPALVTLIRRSLGRDITHLWTNTGLRRRTMTCLQRQYQAGYIDQDSIGCAAYQTIMVIMMIIIMGVVACRFIMALAFYYFFSESIKISKYSPESRYSQLAYHDGYPRPTFSNGDSLDMYTMLLVTCYSEGGEGIRGTLESLAETVYPDDKKLLFVIADGLIKGDDWKATGKTTPEIIVDMILEDPALGEAVPKSYLAIADGAKQHNAARVHAGYYPHNGRHVPIIVVVKCGPESENLSSNAKPGNRGKRDSQMILMNFLSRALFNDRMTPLDHDLYNKIFHITGVTPNVYETILMVDADTRVSPMSLRHMNGAMKADGDIMGLCGETRIANKSDSWVTAIQVFEYYISHHLGKAFESVFAGVTCLPGCFSMYRISAGKGDKITPFLVSPDIVEEYSENVVDTLHKKNLLLLGEDRFLTTLLLRTFPKRKMVFVPKAICHTVVPDKFKVLLSQRRRWINSTIHNLLELVLLRDLCGIFCFSMQFLIALELLGTAILPSTLLSLYVLVLSSFVSPQPLPLILLVSTLLLPGVLISFTTRKWVYVGYMFIYLLALPVWNFILPLYAFWRFDDFSWGETRKVVGDAGAGGHGDKDGEYVAGSVVLKK
ncbi:chitin synthase [Geranomyces variabilis]|nr:chitin synthase [Geranomyces variabilis]